MALEFILLGMLRDEASGYDLRKAFAEGPRHFWSAELSQIYPALQKMEKAGWLSSSRQSSPRGPARRVYKRTSAGTRCLHKWLRDEPIIGTERVAYIGQLVFLAELRDLARTRQFLEALRKQLLMAQHGLESAEAAQPRARKAKPIRDGDDDDFHETLCVRFWTHSIRAKVAACNECLALVKARAQSRAKEA